jgi:hypothetical protein
LALKGRRIYREVERPAKSPMTRAKRIELKVQ